MKKQLLPDNVFELLFGVGAGVVIIGALLKIINGSLIFSANTWLIVGLSVEAGIFVLSGIQGFLIGKKEETFDKFTCGLKFSLVASFSNFAIDWALFELSAFLVPTTSTASPLSADNFLRNLSLGLIFILSVHHLNFVLGAG